MLKPECAKLLKEIAAIDNRSITQETLDAWFAVIGYLPYEVALNALHMARKDDRVQWLEPKHIISWAKEARDKVERLEGRDTPTEDVFEPVPYCPHGIVLAGCLPCCRELAKNENCQ